MVHKQRSLSHAKDRERSRNDTEAIGFMKSFNVLESMKIEQGQKINKKLNKLQDPLDKENQRSNLSPPPKN